MKPTCPARLPNSLQSRLLRVLLCLLLPGLSAGILTAASEPLRPHPASTEEPASNPVSASWPGIGCWFWTAEEFQPEGYKRFLDLHSRHSPFRLLTTSIRYPVEVTDSSVHDQIRRAAEYARQRGLALVMDLDVRLARQAFQEAHPEELQEIVRLREARLDGSQDVVLSEGSMSLGDHYTAGSRRAYETVSSRVLRVYSYRRGPRGIEPQSVEDITARCRILQADRKAVTVAVPAADPGQERFACLMAAFTLFTPDVFAPHLPAFEKRILRQYADVPLAGACKDEWGFPGRFQIRAEDVWFSRFMAEDYARRRPGHDLARDLLLMVQGGQGQEAERAAAVNHYMEAFWQKNRDIELEFFRSVKETFGAEAVAATHPTWFPFPDEREVFKNGLDWWFCRRDLAQTDETTPFGARTALAKKWNSPLWFNMYYNSAREPYDRQLWSSVLSGGRINFHPVYPGPAEKRTTSLLSGNLLSADFRVQLLNHIARAPVDCPAAVIFGHPAALHWAGRKAGDVGLEVCEGLWQAGYYADLIPSSEIGTGALEISADGRIRYGRQEYAADILYHPEFERQELGSFFTRAAARGKTALYRVGDWTRDFEGNRVDGNAALPAAMRAFESSAIVAEVIAHLRSRGLEPQTPGRMQSSSGFPEVMTPDPAGICRLLDGTVILASGFREVLGDPIRRNIRLQGKKIRVDAVGLAAVRLGRDGRVEAMAAGGLRRFHSPGLSLDLDSPADIALWKDATGRWTGIIHQPEGDVPSALKKITRSWKRISPPRPFLP